MIRYSIDNPEMRQLIRLMNETNKQDNLKLLFAFPAIRHIFPELSGWKTQHQVIQALHKFSSDMVREHR